MRRKKDDYAWWRRLSIRRSRKPGQILDGFTISPPSVHVNAATCARINTRDTGRKRTRGNIPLCNNLASPRYTRSAITNIGRVRSASKQSLFPKMGYSRRLDILKRVSCHDTLSKTNALRGARRERRDDFFLTENRFRAVRRALSPA